jgi:hypothetical protein
MISFFTASSSPISFLHLTQSPQSLMNLDARASHSKHSGWHAQIISKSEPDDRSVNLRQPDQLGLVKV